MAVKRIAHSTSVLVRPLVSSRWRLAFHRSAPSALSLKNEESESAERGELTVMSGMMFLSTCISKSMALSKPLQLLSMLAAQPCFSACNDASNDLKASKPRDLGVANRQRFSYHRGVE